MVGFYNAPEAAVAEALSAAAFDANRVVPHPELSTALVGTHLLSSGAAKQEPVPRSTAIITGGGSGHEPFASGFIGAGLLGACVAGGVFASPTATAVQQLIEHVAENASGIEGILVVVLNYQGDRINFARAVQCVRDSGMNLPIEVVTVADDVSIPAAREPRGLAGVSFVLKIAGAAVEAGKSFAEVVALATQASRSVFTVGVAIRPAAMPGAPTESTGVDRMANPATELGLGIHNEPGAETLAFTPSSSPAFAKDVVETILSRMRAPVQVATHARSEQGASPCLAVLVNNLGSVSQLALGVIGHVVGTRLYQMGAFETYRRVFFCAGTLVSSLDMNGFSVTQFVLEDERTVELFCSPTDAPAWPKVMELSKERFNSQPQDAAVAASEGLSVAITDSARFHLHCMQAVLSALLPRTAELGSLDAETGDGDFGDTLKRGCDALMEEMTQGKFNDCSAAEACARIASSTGASMGGTSGGMTSIFFEACAAAYRQQQAWGTALHQGTKAVMEAGGASPGDRTLVDALKPAADVASDGGSAAATAEAASKGAELTKTIAVAKVSGSQFAVKRRCEQVRADRNPFRCAVNRD